MAIVNARGQVDAGHIEPFAAELERGLEAGATQLLVDLSDAEDVTTVAVNALLAARQRLLPARGRLAVVLTRRLRRRFELFELDRRFLLADDRMEAARLLGLGGSRSPDAGLPTPRAHAA